MNFWLESPAHWIMCKIISTAFGVAVVELYDGRPRKGRVRKGLYGLLVEPI